MKHLNNIFVIAIVFLLSTTYIFANSEPISIKTVNIGTQPTDIVAYPNSSTAYIADDYDHTISVINGSGNIITTLSNVYAKGLSINKNTNKIYTETFAVINGGDNTITETKLDATWIFSPEGVVVNPKTDIVYVTNLGGDSVSVFSGTNNNVITSTIEKVGHMPAGIAVNPDTNTIYVANERTDNISVINGATNTVVTKIRVGSNPQHIAVNPDTNTIYVANGHSNSVSVINGTTNSSITTIGVGNFPRKITVNPKTNTIYVTNRDSNTVSVIDGANNKVINTITVGNSPRGITVNPNTNILYVTNFNDGTVSIIKNPDSTLYINSKSNIDPIEMLKKDVNDKMDSIFAKLDTKNKYLLSDGYTLSDNYINFLKSVENKINILLKSSNLSERNKVILNEVKSRLEKKLNNLGELL